MTTPTTAPDHPDVDRSLFTAHLAPTAVGLSRLSVAVDGSGPGWNREVGQKAVEAALTAALGAVGQPTCLDTLIAQATALRAGLDVYGGPCGPAGALFKLLDVVVAQLGEMQASGYQ